MMRIQSLLFLYVFSYGTCEADVYLYKHTYKGVVLGATSLSGVLSIHGKPKKKEVNINNIFYGYEEFGITISNITNKAETVIIVDQSYRTSTGNYVGQEKESFSKGSIDKTNKVWYGNYSLADYTNGVVYNFVDDRVDNIVLSYSLLNKNYD